MGFSGLRGALCYIGGVMRGRPSYLKFVGLLVVGALLLAGALGCVGGEPAAPEATADIAATVAAAVAAALPTATPTPRPTPTATPDIAATIAASVSATIAAVPPTATPPPTLAPTKMPTLAPLPAPTPGYCGGLCSPGFWGGSATDKVFLEAQLAKGVDVTAADKEGATALHRAAFLSTPESVALLLRYGADAAARDDHGRTALHFAVSAEHGTDAGIVSALLAHGADAAAKDEAGATVLHWAMWAYPTVDIETIRLLLSHGADAAATDERGRTALHYTSDSAGIAIYELLLSHGANFLAVDADGKTALHSASAFHDAAVVKILIEQGISPNAKDDRALVPLHYAVSTCSDNVPPAAIAVLLDYGADPNAKTRREDDGDSPLHLVMCSSSSSASGDPLPVDPEIVALLIKYGADSMATNVYGETPLHLAMAHCNPDVVRILLENGANPNGKDYAPVQGAPGVETSDMTPLRNIASYGCNHAGNRLEVVNLLLGYGADVTVVDGRFGWTALHGAAKSGDARVIESLLAHGADPAATGRGGETACDIASPSVRHLVCN